MKTRFFHAFLIFVFALLALPCAAWTGSGTYEDPYLISTASDLLDLQANVNLGTTYSGSYFLQTADIELPATNWEGIGSISSDRATTNAFMGNYDGDGCYISNLTITANIDADDTATKIYGLFTVALDASISNVKAQGKITVHSLSSTGYIWCGSIIGTCFGTCLFEALESHVDIYYDNPNTIDAQGFRTYFGGVIGRARLNRNVTWLALVNYGKITTVAQWRTSSAGVMAEYYRGNQTTSATLKGWENHGKVSSSSSSSSSSASSSSSSSSSSACGIAYTSQPGASTFTRCVNYGDIIVTGGCWHACGILSTVDSANTSVTPKYCENRGDIYLFDGDGNTSGYFGIIGGHAYQGQSYSYNTNYGNFRIEGKTAGRYEIAGISGMRGYSVNARAVNSHCANFGNLEYIGLNTSGVEEVSVGGIQGPTVIMREYFYRTEYCANYGTLKISSQNKNSTTKLGIGGVACCSSPNGAGSITYVHNTILNNSANFGKLIMEVPDDFAGVADISGVCAAYSQIKADVRINWCYNLGNIYWKGKNIRIGGIMGLQDAETTDTEYDHINHSYSICSYYGSTNDNYVGSVCGFSQGVTGPVTISNTFAAVVNQNIPAFGFFNGAYTNNVKGYTYGEIYGDLYIPSYFLPTANFIAPTYGATYYDYIAPINTQAFPSDTDAVKALHNVTKAGGFKRFIRFNK